MKNVTSISSEKCKHIQEAIICLLLFAFLYIWSMVQPLYEQPDEWCRYILPYYMMETGKLPNGNVPSLIIGTYGVSYAFFPGLPYIFMAAFMKIISFFTTSSYVLLMSARTVNILAAVITFIFLRRIAERLFTSSLAGWFFSLTAILWPQVLFIFTYVNCDGFAYMSCAIIIYALADGIKNGWRKGNINWLAIGIAICLLSYFNAYGMIVGAFITFVLSFIKRKDKENELSGEGNVSQASRGKYVFDIKGCIMQGLIVAGLVFVLAGWWFIRSAVLYEGDFIGLAANARCAEQYAIDAFKPSMKETIQSAGGSIMDLLRNQDYMFLVKQSFFGRFGNMILPASNFVLRGYKLILFAGMAGIALTIAVAFINVIKRKKVNKQLAADALAKKTSVGKACDEKRADKTTRINEMVYGVDGIPLCGLLIGNAIAAFIAAFLCVWYSYSNDYQPQGRYILPAVIPMLTIIFGGIGKLTQVSYLFEYRGRKLGKYITYFIYACIFTYLILASFNCLHTIYTAYYPEINDTMALSFYREF